MTVISPYITLVDRNGKLTPEGVRLLQSFVARDAAAEAVDADARLDALEATTGGLTAAVVALDTEVDGKQDTLVSATNIKTINGNTLLGAGDLAVTASVLAGSAVLTVANGAISASATVTAAVTPSSRIVVALGTMLDGDENDAELLDVAALAAVPGIGSFVIQAAFLTPTAGAVPVNWSVL